MKILLASLTISLLIACSASTTVSSVIDSEPMNEVQVVRVIDGDTLDIMISDIKYRV